MVSRRVRSAEIQLCEALFAVHAELELCAPAPLSENDEVTLGFEPYSKTRRSIAT
jgi:hypothetical protein